MCFKRGGRVRLGACPPRTDRRVDGGREVRAAFFDSTPETARRVGMTARTCARGRMPAPPRSQPAYAGRDEQRHCAACRGVVRDVQQADGDRGAGARHGGRRRLTGATTAGPSRAAGPSQDRFCCRTAPGDRAGTRPGPVSACAAPPPALCNSLEEAPMPSIRFHVLGAAVAAGVSALAAGPAAARGSVGVFIGAGPPVYYAPPPPRRLRRPITPRRRLRRGITRRRPTGTIRRQRTTRRPRRAGTTRRRRPTGTGRTDRPAGRRRRKAEARAVG